MLSRLGEEMDYEQAHIWQKEAFFQNGRAARFIEMQSEMDDLSPQAVVRRHFRKIGNLLAKDRKETGLALFSDEVISDT